MERKAVAKKEREVIFEVNAERIGRLDEHQLVELLRRLILAELNKHSIPLSSGTAPAQITIPDGGEDARVEWKGGPDKTDWLPKRFTVFQCKKGTISPSSLKKEVQKSDSSGLKDALKNLIGRNGAYVVVTTSAVVGAKHEERINGIKLGISESGSDPNLLSEITIYDCNRLASWTNSHPAVAFWLNGLLREVSLKGFQTYESWSRSYEVCSVEFQKSDDVRFVAKGQAFRSWKGLEKSAFEANDFEGIRQTIFSFFQTQGRSVRVTGASGYGKTRFVHQLIAESEEQETLSATQVIYCTYEDVENQLINEVREIVDSGSRSLVIVDDCPDEEHIKLAETVQRIGSNSHLITIGVETTSEGLSNNLVVELQEASNELVERISKAVSPTVTAKNKLLIRELSQGFPRMAILASQAIEERDHEISSVETLISRILWGNRREDSSALESLQIFSLFTIVGMDKSAAAELEEIAKFSEKSLRKMFRELQNFANRKVLFRQGDYGEVQPLPLAIRLSKQWIESNPAGTLEELFGSLSDNMRLKLLGRLKWLAWADEVKTLGHSLLQTTVLSVETLDSELNSKIVERISFLAPEATVRRLNTLFSDVSIDDLLSFSVGRRNVIWMLERLAFRRQTFDLSAKLLLKLAAAENEGFSNNASGQFKQLYQLYLSGTEALPEEKLAVLDDGLASSDQRIRQVCVSALNEMLEDGHFSRSSGVEYISISETLEDWSPTTYGEILDYFKAALSRLKQIALKKEDPCSREALEIIGTRLRSMFSYEVLYEELHEIVSDLLEAYPGWYQPALAVNEWLYFDRDKAPKPYQEKLRAYYDELIPSETLDKIYYYSNGAGGVVYNPDAGYSNADDDDFYYGQQQAYALIDSAPKVVEYFLPLVDSLLESPVNLGPSVIRHISLHVHDSERLMHYLLNNIESGNDISSLVRSALSGLAQVDRNKALECLSSVLDVPSLSASKVEMIRVVGLDDQLMRLVIALVQNDEVEPSQVRGIAFNRILQDVDTDLVESLVNVLLQKSASGAWASIEFLRFALRDSKPIDDKLFNGVKSTVLNRCLFDKPRYSNMDWYYWHYLVERLLESYDDDKFISDLLDFIISVTSIQGYTAIFAFKKGAKKVLVRLSHTHSRLVWEKYLEARKAGSQHELGGLADLFETNINEPELPGVLNNIPEDIYIPWMLEERDERVTKVLKWIKLFDDETNRYKWDAKFIQFIEKYVTRQEVLEPLRSRLTTGVWVGTLVQKLDSEYNRLSKLRCVITNPHVLLWIDRMLVDLEEQIDLESQYDANREASFKA